MHKKYYRNRTYWKKYQSFLPEELKFNQNLPDESWWIWKGSHIHMDSIGNRDSNIKFIMLHGGGGNGRLLGSYGSYFTKQGYDYIAPDLPGFGLTIPKKEHTKSYSIWVNLVNDLVNKESKKDNKKIILFGGSIGGLLAYNVACINKNVKGIIVTCLADPRKEKARDALAKNKVWSRIGYFFMKKFPLITNKINIRANWISKMNYITNDPEFSKVFMNDSLVGKTKMNLGFYKTMTEYNPKYEPENFNNCPVLLVHPEKDRWTPFEISKEFFNSIKGEKYLQILKDEGHYPYKGEGFKQMKKAMKEFISKIDKK